MSSMLVPDLTQTASCSAFRAGILHFLHDPGLAEQDSRALQAFSDGLLLVADGKVLAVGDYASLAPQLPAHCALQDLRGYWIMPGFIDTHSHYPQSEMLASPAPGLLPWLERYTFPTERQFADPRHARRVADFYLQQLLASGITTAAVYCTVHPASVDAFFEAAQARNLRMIAGKVLMDRHAPDFLLDAAQSGVEQSEALLQKWHGKGRALYAITPRFAPTSSPAQLQLAGELAARYPHVWVQTHLAENRDEIAWVQELFPHCRSYTDVYARYGLLNQRSILGHAIWLDANDRSLLAERQAILSHCPSSNLFLGSGLYDVQATLQAGVHTTLACDVGGGSAFSMLRTMHDAYTVARLSGCYLPALQMFYQATLGAARALKLDHLLGNFTPGKEADFIVLNPAATPLLHNRHARCQSIEEILFMLALLGDERAVVSTWAAGVLRHQQSAPALASL
ncbi:guanine deaminase [Massilia sp. W12]|uniref:guanine deaminase n=1 Tax=Massilia sp. W12 TaxID=3126507 RepID=UPI0030D52F3B